MKICDSLSDVNSLATTKDTRDPIVDPFVYFYIVLLKARRAEFKHNLIH